jgi:hypothetical protein
MKNRMIFKSDIEKSEDIENFLNRNNINYRLNKLYGPGKHLFMVVCFDAYQELCLRLFLGTVQKI